MNHYDYEGGTHHSRLPTTSIAPEVMNQKFQKVYERLGFIEDSLSRVELQQDSMRPQLKLLELSQPALKTLSSANLPVAQISAHVRK